MPESSPISKMVVRRARSPRPIAGRSGNARPRLAAAMVVLVWLLLLGFVASPASARIMARDLAFNGMINAERVANGLVELPLSRRMSRVAREHSRQMAAARSIFHSNLRPLLRRPHVRVVAENVGQTKNLADLVDMFMGSDIHREQILDSRWKKTGVGVVRRHGWFWVTQLFYA